MSNGPGFGPLTVVFDEIGEDSVATELWVYPIEPGRKKILEWGIRVLTPVKRDEEHE